MSRQAEHVKSRRKQGLCGYEGCPEMTGPKFRCKKHAAAHAARARKRYAEEQAEKEDAA